MNRCKIHPIMISRLVDGELSRNEMQILQMHFQACIKCARIHEHYRRQKELVSCCFSEQPLPATAYGVLRDNSEKKTGPLAVPVWAYGLAAMAVILIAVVSVRVDQEGPGAAVSGSLTAPPAYILESYAPSTMSQPLSSLVYYEELAGRAVLSQFVQLTPRVSSENPTTTRQYILSSFHESQLFYDNTLKVRHSGEQLNEQTE